MGRKLAGIRGAMRPLEWGGGGTRSNSVAWAEVYLHTKWHLDPSNRLVTIHQRHRQDRQTGQTDRTDNGLIA